MPLLASIFDSLQDQVADQEHSAFFIKANLDQPDTSPGEAGGVLGMALPVAKVPWKHKVLYTAFLEPLHGEVTEAGWSYGAATQAVPSASSSSRARAFHRHPRTSFGGDKCCCEGSAEKPTTKGVTIYPLGEKKKAADWAQAAAEKIGSKEDTACDGLENKGKKYHQCMDKDGHHFAKCTKVAGYQKLREQYNDSTNGHRSEVDQKLVKLTQDSENVSKALKCKMDMYERISQAYKNGLAFNGKEMKWNKDDLQSFDLAVGEGKQCPETVTLAGAADEQSLIKQYNNKLGINEVMDGEGDPGIMKAKWSELKENPKRLKDIRESIYKMQKGFQCLAKFFSNMGDNLQAGISAGGIHESWLAEDGDDQAKYFVNALRKKKKGIPVADSCEASLLSGDKGFIDPNMKEAIWGPIFKAMTKANEILANGGSRDWKKTLSETKTRVQGDIKKEFERVLAEQGFAYDRAHFETIKKEKDWKKKVRDPSNVEALFQVPPHKKTDYDLRFDGENRHFMCCCANESAGGCSKRNDCDNSKHEQPGACK
mmetsp:Transcript_78055/g.135354  ORF Transcript_78055/g.135354 Transcript_78055/m.135354 type:complete len:540 (-) Transcript_78055:51-1670(-)